VRTKFGVISHAKKPNPGQGAPNDTAHVSAAGLAQTRPERATSNGMIFPLAKCVATKTDMSCGTGNGIT